MKNVTAQRAKFEEIPPEKRARKVRNTAIGLGSIGLAVVIEWKFAHLSDMLTYTLIGFGGYSLAGDLVRGFAGFIPAAVRDVRAAIKGNGKKGV